MFAKRNSATLAIIWLLILIVGIFWYFRDSRRLSEAVAEEKQVRTTLAESQSEVRRLTDVETIHRELKEKWEGAPKRIISAEEPAFTLNYLSWLVNSNNLNIYYDFVVNARKETDDVTQFTYTLTGEGPYDDVNKLIWHLTYQPVLYIVNNIGLSRRSRDSDYVGFNMKLNGFTVDRKSETYDQVEDFEGRRLPSPGRIHDIFKPVIQPKPVARTTAPPKRVAPSKPQLPARKPGEIDVSKASLKAVTPGSVFIADETGKVKQLELGASVYLGRLVRINQERNEAEFILTKFGKQERVVLSIDARK